MDSYSSVQRRLKDKSPSVQHLKDLGIFQDTVQNNSKIKPVPVQLGIYYTAEWGKKGLSS